jgi:hypothetical protein
MSLEMLVDAVRHVVASNVIVIEIGNGQPRGTRPLVCKIDMDLDLPVEPHQRIAAVVTEA